MIEACVEMQVKRLIYTSSASVVFDGVRGVLNADESLSYPVKVSISLFVFPFKLFSILHSAKFLRYMILELV